MTTEEFEKLVDTGRQRRDRIMCAKGQDYTISDPDRLANFKNVAKRLGITPLQAWGVYWLKHVDAVCNFIKTDGRSQSEPITGRLDDISNYNSLLEAINAEASRVPD